jgi:hypothetical protein
MSNQPQTVINITSPGSNGLGIAGLVFSILGWFTCGLLCIPGAILSFAGLFSRQPKGTAIAGLIVGFPGVLFFLFAGIGMITAFFGIGVAASSLPEIAARAERQRLQQNAASPAPIAEESTTPQSEEAPENTPPSTETTNAASPIEAEPQPEPQPEPAPLPVEEKPLRKVFTDPTGKFRVDATVIGYKSGWLRLRRKDGKPDTSVEVAKLSEDDQSWVEENMARLTALAGSK